MKLEDLQSLKLAIDTNNHSFYNGNIDDALSELVEEAIATRDELSDATDHGVEDVAELVSLYRGAMNEVAKFEGDKENTVEILTGCSCIKEDEDYEYTISNNSGRLELHSSAVLENKDYEIIVRVIR